jgi:hypothetical protein
VATIWEYYDRTSALRETLIVNGHRDLSQQLLAAERGAGTGGEALNDVGVVLRRLAGVDLPPSVRDEVEAVMALGDSLWNGETGVP